MDTSFVSQILEKWSTFAILAFILYYFLVIYIPKKDEAYERRIDTMMTSFKDSMENLAKTLDTRLIEIENKINK